MVTGASRGIGLGVAKALADSGANLILVARDPQALTKAAKELQRDKIDVRTSAFDLQNTREIADWFTTETRTFGPADILINSAGITRRGEATELTLEAWNETFNLNATAVFELSRSFARERIKAGRQGKIVNIASLMTAAARRGTSAYAASKGAVGQLTKALAIDWASSGIHVNAIAPGYVETDLTKELIADAEFNLWVQKRCPLGRWATPEDIAWPVVFLASAASDFITGQVIYVDGGWLSTF
jgi:gluconate 5-dehydrogenase